MIRRGLSHRFKDILDWQLEIDIGAFLTRTKFDDDGLFFGADARVVNRSWHVTEIASPRLDSETYYITAWFDILGFEVTFSIDVGGREQLAVYRHYLYPRMHCEWLAIWGPKVA